MHLKQSQIKREKANYTHFLLNKKSQKKEKLIYTLDLVRALPRPRRPVTSCEQNNNKIVNNTSQLMWIMAISCPFFHVFPPEKTKQKQTKTYDNWHTDHNFSTDDKFERWLLLHRIQSANVTINGISFIFSRLISLVVLQNTSTLQQILFS